MMLQWKRNNIEYALMALPAVLLLFIFNYLPMFGIIIAFKDYKPWLGIFGSSWNGLENFKFFFGSMDAVRVLRNTLGYNTAFIVLNVVAGVALAFMLYFVTSKTLRKAYNTVVLIHKFMSWVLIAYIVQILLNPSDCSFIGSNKGLICKNNSVIMKSCSSKNKM